MKIPLLHDVFNILNLERSIQPNNQVTTDASFRKSDQDPEEIAHSIDTEPKVSQPPINAKEFPILQNSTLVSNSKASSKDPNEPQKIPSYPQDQNHSPLPEMDKIGSIKQSHTSEFPVGSM